MSIFSYDKSRGKKYPSEILKRFAFKSYEVQCIGNIDSRPFLKFWDTNNGKEMKQLPLAVMMKIASLSYAIEWKEGMSRKVTFCVPKDNDPFRTKMQVAFAILNPQDEDCKYLAKCAAVDAYYRYVLRR